MKILEITIIMSFEQLKKQDVIRDFEYDGSRGNLHISLPSLVIVPSSVIAPKRCSYLSACKMYSLSGGSI